MAAEGRRDAGTGSAAGSGHDGDGLQPRPRARTSPTSMTTTPARAGCCSVRYPHLDPEQLAPMTPVTIPSRDGLDLHSYLTLPVGVEPSGCRWCCSSTAVRGPATGGDSIPRCSCWPTAVMRCCRSTSAVRRLRQGVRQGRDRRVRGQDARRPDRRRELGRQAGLRGPRPRRHLRWLLRRLRDAGRRHVHPGRVRRRDRLRRHLQPGQLHAHAARRSPGRTWPTTGTCSSATPTTRSRWPTCWPARRSRSVDQIRTPLLVIQGANDVRVVQAESDNIVEALRPAASRSSTWSRTTRGTASRTRRT